MQDVGNVTGARSFYAPNARITTSRFGQFHAGSGRARAQVVSQYRTAAVEEGGRVNESFCLQPGNGCKARFRTGDILRRECAERVADPARRSFPLRASLRRAPAAFAARTSR